MLELNVRHIEKLKISKVRMGKRSIEVVKTVMLAWENIVNSDTKQSYIDNCNRFKVVCDKFPKFLEYVEITILGPVKEDDVKFQVNKAMHLGNTTTNRADSAHNRLKSI